MTSIHLDPYDVFHYPNYCYPQTEPDHLGSLATFLGMQPAPAEKCRVLELACGDGANLIPMAFNLPHSQFVGIDRATQPVTRGMQLIEDLQLRNVTLEVGDILELPPKFGEFDYIVAHGLYSWVPPNVQDKILEICRSCLSPQGVAYISYNVYPGGHLRAISRELMFFHTRTITDSRERVAQARQVVKWVADAQSNENGYAQLMKEISKSVAARDVGAIFHDDLAEINSPAYFHQFVTSAAGHGLKFLCEAEYFNVRESDYSPEVVAQLQAMAEDDVLGKEQYQDFLEGRSFRQTLLCHHEVKLDRTLRPEIIGRFSICAPTTPVSATPDLTSDSVEQFHGPKGSMIVTSLPLAKAAMAYLGEIYPHSVSFDELLLNAYLRLDTLHGVPNLNREKSDESQALAEVILKAFGAGVTQLHLHQPEFVAKPSEHPMASSLARLQSERGQVMTSLLYNSVKFEDPLLHQLFSLLDGTRDRQMLLNEFRRLVVQNLDTLAISTEEREKVMGNIAGQLEDKLNELGRLGFLFK